MYELVKFMSKDALLILIESIGFHTQTSLSFIIVNLYETYEENDSVQMETVRLLLINDNNIPEL